MPYVNDTKPTSSFTNDTKPTIATIAAGMGIGLLLSLTYASSNGETFTNDSEITSTTYSNDSKP